MIHLEVWTCKLKDGVEDMYLYSKIFQWNFFWILQTMDYEREIPLFFFFFNVSLFIFGKMIWEEDFNNCKVLYIMMVWSIFNKVLIIFYLQ